MMECDPDDPEVKMKTHTDWKKFMLQVAEFTSFARISPKDTVDIIVHIVLCCERQHDAKLVRVPMRDFHKTRHASTFKLVTEGS